MPWNGAFAVLHCALATQLPCVELKHTCVPLAGGETPVWITADLITLLSIDEVRRSFSRATETAPCGHGASVMTSRPGHAAARARPNKFPPQELPASVQFTESSGLEGHGSTRSGKTRREGTQTLIWDTAPRVRTFLVEPFQRSLWFRPDFQRREALRCSAVRMRNLCLLFLVALVATGLAEKVSDSLFTSPPWKASSY